MRRFFWLSLAAWVTVAFTVSAQTGQAPSSSSSSVPAKANKGAKSAESKPANITVVPAIAEPKRDYSQEGFVIEKFQSTYRFENDGTGRKETKVRIRVQSEAGVQQWGQIQVGYNSASERLEIIYVRVVKADGSIVKASEDAVQDLTA